MMKNIATTNSIISLTVNGAPCEASITKDSSNKFKCHGYNCYSGSLTIYLTGIVSSLGACESAIITINGTADKVYANGSKVLRQDDKGSVVAMFKSGTQQIEGTIEATISNAGQDKVKAA